MLKKWYETDTLTLLFSDNPKIQIREVLPTMGIFEKKDALIYPYVLMKKIDVTVFYHKEGMKYEFSVPKGFCWNGSDIPRFLWSIIGSQDEPQYLVASCLHDYLCIKHEAINNNRRLSSEIFKVCLLEADVPKCKANIMMECVDLYQRFCRW